MLLITLLATLATGTLNLVMGWNDEGLLLLGMSALSLSGIILGHRGQPDLAGLVLVIAVFTAVFAAAYSGAGIYDASMAAFPVSLLCAAFLFGNRPGLVIATPATIAAVFVLHALQLSGAIQTQYPPSVPRALVLAVIYSAMAGITWAVRESWDENLSQLVESYEATLRGWARALEYKGGDIAGHSQRVTDMSVALAKRLGCDAEELDAIRRGAYLHDIGKMGIPDAILLKPGPLNAEERRVIEQHPTLGRSLVSEIPFLQPAAEIAYAHHERWDGMGYPEGLAGEAIPRGARIFAVADHWDALRSDRPYRKAWSVAETRAHMQENSGTIFDPQVVAALLELPEATLASS